MKIACLGWGSLVWDPRNLPSNGEWFSDGPMLPIEFARESRDGRITLVIVEESDPVPSMWTFLDVENLDQAKYGLACREGISPEYVSGSIGCWDRETNNSHGRGSTAIRNWAEPRDLDAVVWTNLRYGFRDSYNSMPSVDQVIAHLSKLEGDALERAKEYILKAPEQTKTPFREQICQALQWIE